MNHLIKITFLFFVFTLIGCNNNSTDDLEDNKLILNSNYTLNVKPIIDNNCIQCHGTVPSNGAPMPLTTFNDVKNAVLNRGLLDRISRTQGSEGMMPNGGTRLTEDKINLIRLWSYQGFQQ